eukprot:scaffold14366_cov94-Isochrysis_galbana.AAC.2
MRFVVVCAPTRQSPFLGGRGGSNSLSTKTSTLPKHVATRQGRHKGAGKGTYTSCSEGGGPLRGGLLTPLSGAGPGCRLHPPPAARPAAPAPPNRAPTPLAAPRRPRRPSAARQPNFHGFFPKSGFSKRPYLFSCWRRG